MNECVWCDVCVICVCRMLEQQERLTNLRERLKNQKEQIKQTRNKMADSLKKASSVYCILKMYVYTTCACIHNSYACIFKTIII